MKLMQSLVGKATIGMEDSSTQIKVFYCNIMEVETSTLDILIYIKDRFVAKSHILQHFDLITILPTFDR